VIAQPSGVYIDKTKVAMSSLILGLITTCAVFFVAINSR
jgi:hypothetical protein